MEIFLDVQLILFISKCKVTSPISLVTFTLNCTCISRWKQIQDDLQIQMAPSAWVWASQEENIADTFCKENYAASSKADNTRPAAAYYFI